MLVLIRAQSCCLEEHQKSEMTRGRHGDHVSVMVLGNPQNCFFNRSIGNFDGLVCTPFLSDASVFLEDCTQITSEQVAQQLLADPMARFFSGLLGQRLVGGGCAAPRVDARCGGPHAPADVLPQRDARAPRRSDFQHCSPPKILRRIVLPLG